MRDSDQREVEEQGIDELHGEMTKLAENFAGRARRLLDQRDEARRRCTLAQDNENRLRSERDEALAVIEDNPDHADLDAAAFELNMANGRVTELEAEVERLDGVIACKDRALEGFLDMRNEAQAEAKRQTEQRHECARRAQRYLTALNKTRAERDVARTNANDTAKALKRILCERDEALLKVETLQQDQVAWEETCETLGQTLEQAREENKELRARLEELTIAYLSDPIEKDAAHGWPPPGYEFDVESRTWATTYPPSVAAKEARASRWLMDPAWRAPRPQKNKNNYFPQTTEICERCAIMLANSWDVCPRCGEPWKSEVP